MLGVQTLKSVRSLSEITSGSTARADNQGNNKLKRQIHAMASQPHCWWPKTTGRLLLPVSRLHPKTTAEPDGIG